jgi:hypothetical protein
MVASPVIAAKPDQGVFSEAHIPQALAQHPDAPIHRDDFAEQIRNPRIQTGATGLPLMLALPRTCV